MCGETEIILTSITSYTDTVTFLHSQMCGRVGERRKLFILKSHLPFSLSFCFHFCPTAIHLCIAANVILDTLKMYIITCHDHVEGPPMAVIL